VLSVVLITIFTNFSCSANSIDTEYVIGKIINLETTSITKVDTLSIIDKNDQIWVFKSDGQLGHFTPAHLKYHMIQGESVKIVFQYESQIPMILDITDYP